MCVFALATGAADVDPEDRSSGTALSAAVAAVKSSEDKAPISVSAPVKVEAPLKFMINPETGLIEDAPGSYLIHEYDLVVGDLNEGYGSTIDAVLQEIDKLNLALEEMEEGTIERSATELYLKMLQGKIVKAKRRRAYLVDQKLELEKSLKAIHRLENSENSAFEKPRQDLPGIKIVNHIFFQRQSFRSLEDLTECYTQGKGQLYFKLNFNIFSLAQISSYGSSQPFLKLIKVQKAIFKRAEVIYRIQSHTEHKMDPEARLCYASACILSNVEKKSVAEVLNEEIDNLVYKVENRTIPKLAPIYRLALVISAFTKEAPRHKSVP